jgi:hypothetical protein
MIHMPSALQHPAAAPTSNANASVHCDRNDFTSSIPVNDGTLGSCPSVYQLLPSSLGMRSLLAYFRVLHFGENIEGQINCTAFCVEEEDEMKG